MSIFTELGVDPQFFYTDNSEAVDDICECKDGKPNRNFNLTKMHVKKINGTTKRFLQLVQR
jgi:hypothetical protein